MMNDLGLQTINCRLCLALTKGGCRVGVREQLAVQLWGKGALVASQACLHKTSGVLDFPGVRAHVGRVLARLRVSGHEGGDSTTHHTNAQRA